MKGGDAGRQEPEEQSERERETEREETVELWTISRKRFGSRFASSIVPSLQERRAFVSLPVATATVGNFTSEPHALLTDSELQPEALAYTHTDTHRHTQTHTDTHRHTQTHTDTHRHACTLVHRSPVDQPCVVEEPWGSSLHTTSCHHHVPPSPSSCVSTRKRQSHPSCGVYGLTAPRLRGGTWTMRSSTNTICSHVSFKSVNNYDRDVIFHVSLSKQSILVFTHVL